MILYANEYQDLVQIRVNLEQRACVSASESAHFIHYHCMMLWAPGAFFQVALSASAPGVAIAQALAETFPLGRCRFSSFPIVPATLALGLETIEDLVPGFFLPARSRVFVTQHWRERSEGELPIGPLKGLLSELWQTFLQGLNAHAS
jgi:hypothetical protein